MPEFTISEITEYLYLSSLPRRAQAEQLRGMGIRLIISVYWKKPDKTLREPPMKLLWMPIIDSPVTPIPMNVFRQGVRAALPVIEDGWKVLVHCGWGVHRSAAMACAILIGKGYTTDEAVELVKRQRSIAKPDDGYVLWRIKLFEQEWKGQVQGVMA
jgi:atypical dual specificity phosphatase